MIRALVAVTMLVAGPALAMGPDPWAGSELHRYGRWRNAPVAARIDGGPRLPPGRLACAGCHGADRAGGSEGGVVAPPLRPDRLAKQGLETPDALARALFQGVLPDGSRLNVAMPRFTLDAAAVLDLLAYLRDPLPIDAPGVSAGEVRLGALLPEHLHEARAMLNRWTGDLAAHGIWGRRPKLVWLPAAPDALQAALEDEPVLAVVAPLVDVPARAVLAARGVPELAPLTPPIEPERRIRILALGPSLADQASLLVELLADRLPGPRALPVLLPAGETGALLWRAVSENAERHPGLRLQPLAVGDPWPRNLYAAGGMLLLTRPPGAELLSALAPTSLVAGPLDLLAGHVAAETTRGIWLLTDPRAAAPPAGNAMARHLRVATRLVELGLEGAGRRLTRHSLLQALTRGPLDLGGATPLDYAAHPGRGSTMAEVLEVEPSSGRLLHHAPRAPTTNP